MYPNKRGWLTLLCSFLLVLCCAASAWAVEINSGDVVNLSSGKIKGPLFVSGNNIKINADVDGDVFAAGQSIDIDGNVNGDVIAAGNSIRINGNVLGDVRSFSNTIDIYGQIEGNLTGAGNNINLRQGSIIKRDAILFGSMVNLMGNISGQAMGGGKQMNLNGQIGSDARIWDVQQLKLGPAAVINGMITYNSANEAQIDVHARVGKITRLDPPVQPTPKAPRPGISWLGVLWSLAAGAVIWGVFNLFFPRLFPYLAKNTINSPLPTLGGGFLSILLVPLAALLLMFTIIGIPLALILILIFVIIISAAKILTADLITRYLAAQYNWEKGSSFFAVFLITLLALILFTKIHILALFLNVIIISTALGMLISGIYKQSKGSSPSTSGPVD